MEQGKRSGGLGLIGLLAIGAAYMAARRFMPSLASVLLWLLGIAAAVVALVVIAVVVLAFRKPKQTAEDLVREERESILKNARVSLMKLRTAAMRVRDEEIRGSADRFCASMDRILRILKEQPEDLPRARKFLNHTLPLTGGILEKYSRLEQNGVVTEEVRRRTVASLQQMEQAVGQQHDALFDNDIVDITAEMEVLNQLCMQSGLPTE